MLSRFVCSFYVLAAVVGMASKSCRSAVFFVPIDADIDLYMYVSAVCMLFVFAPSSSVWLSVGCCLSVGVSVLARGLGQGVDQGAGGAGGEDAGKQRVPPGGFAGYSLKVNHAPKTGTTTESAAVSYCVVAAF